MLYPELIQSDWEVLLEKSLGMVTATNPNLANFTVDSPTMALMEGVIYVTEDFSYRLNELPKVIISEWLRYWGGSGMVALPSVGTVTVQLASPLAETALIPAGTKFYVPDITQVLNVPLGQNSPVQLTFLALESVVIPAFSTAVNVPVISQSTGALTNVPVNAVSQIDNLSQLAPLVSSVTSTAMSGGRDIDDSDATIIRTLSDVTAARTLISANDFRGAIRSLIPGSFVKVVPNLLSDGVTKNVPGNVHCFVLVPGFRGVNPTESSQLINILEERLPVGFQLHISPMTITDLYVQVIVKLERTADSEQTYQQIRENLRDYLNPYNGLESVLYKELEYLARDVNGVHSVGGAYISKLGLDINDTQSINLQSETPSECFNLASLQVKMVTPFGVELTYGESFFDETVVDTQEFEIIEDLTEEFGEV